MSRCISRAGEYGDHVLADTGTAVERFVCSRCFVVAEDELFAEVDSLRAKLAAAEQERDSIFGEALRYKRLRIEEKSRADRAERALAAVRELPHEDWCCGGGCSNPYHRAGCSDCYCWKSDVEAAVTAAAEQDEPKRNEIPEPDGQSRDWSDALEVMLLEESRPKREQS